MMENDFELKYNHIKEELLKQEAKIVDEMLSCNIFINRGDFAMAVDSNKKLGTYHPKKNGRNPYFDSFSQLILDVKNNKEPAIQYFTERLYSILSHDTEYVICVMPNHKKGRCTSGMISIAKRLCKSPIIDGTDFIVRKNTIPEKHKRGFREPDPLTLIQEIESLVIENADIIKGKQVLLLDDVATTGTSLKAGRYKLKEAGADLVAAIVLGHTHKGY